MNDLVKAIKAERVGREGVYVIRDEVWEGPDGERTDMTYCYTPAGDTIGNLEKAQYLCDKLGIAPQPRRDEDIGTGQQCSIGFCEQEQKWYGWSHRAIYGFGVGDVVKEGDCAASSGWTDDYLEMHPEADESVPVGFEAKTLDDAKRIAQAFAASVS